MRRIEPVYANAGAGGQPHPLERMLRIHLMQTWFNRLGVEIAVQVVGGEVLFP